MLDWLECPVLALNYRGIFTFYEQEDSWRTGKFYQRWRKHNGAPTSIDAMIAGVDRFERKVERVVFCPYVFHTHCVGTLVTVGGVYSSDVVMNVFFILEKAEFDFVG